MQGETVKNWRVPSSLSEVQKTSTQVLSFFGPLKLADAYLFDIRLCLEEALINAMKHGSGFCPELPVELQAGYDKDHVWIRVEDKGEGFDVKKVHNCTQEEHLTKQGGRGVYLIHRLMDRVQYNTKGNGVLMTKFIDKNFVKKEK